MDGQKAIKTTTRICKMKDGSTKEVAETEEREFKL